ncbi:hypothetical protein [Actinoplanes derwentensis]|uniref:Uncharacterized protein n=1 Tax=Actinoplanes derwentensis TaxID=113562 RepID=A0A1H2CW47_9ACTN|nr:hypothetical protein [Actinoplanes derwentensis]GID81972.1 hypothetical protein Ade03nite_08960 [Actinoplanes derwentensis]SDT74246.1 hypothetical protein SAMN04489716_6921 [Actinoplanes derwentensis]
MAATTTTAKITTLALRADGQPILTGLPWMIDGLREDGKPGQARRLMNRHGFGWEWDRDNGGWVPTTDSAFTADDVIMTLAEHGVDVIDLTGAAAKPAIAKPATRKGATAAANPATRRAAAKPAPAAVQPVTGATLAETITAALVADGVDAEIIAAAVAAAVAKANTLAKTATAKPATRRGATAKPVPAAVKPATRKATAGGVAVTSEGERVLTVAAGVPIAAAAKAARQALSRAKVKGVSVRKEGRTLVAYGHDGGAVSTDVDAVMIAAVASVA